MSNAAPHIALIGGGTGSFTILNKLKDYTPNISALVNMSDNGGSTGRLRDEHGVLPPGDVRQCLVALSRVPEVRDLFDYRFDKGDLSGHSAGNIVLSALELKYGDFIKAVDVASSILNIIGQVVPITVTNHELIMHDGDQKIVGEYEISKHHITSKSPRLELKPGASANPQAIEAIMTADIVVIAPGNFYGSLLPALSVEGVAKALQNTDAKKVMIANLVNKPGQNDGWRVVDYLSHFSKCIGSNVFDIVLYNTSLPSTGLLKKYAQDGEFPVDIELGQFKNRTNTEFMGADLLARDVVRQDKADKAIKRTLIRHDADKVARQLMRIYYS